MSPKAPNGAGSTYKRKDGRWVASIYLTEASGRRVRRTVYGKTRAEALAALDELRALQRSGRPVPPGQLTLRTYLAEWLDLVVADRVRPSTLVAYRHYVERYLAPDLGDKKLAALTARELRIYLDSLRRRGVGVRSIRYVHATLRTALEDAVRDELLQRNVAKLVRAPRQPAAEPQPYTVEEAQQLLRSTRDDRLHAMYVVLCFLGLRRSELLGLMWDDVDLDLGVIRIRRGLHRVATGLETLEPKTLRSRRSIPAPRPVLEALCVHRELQAAERDKLAGSWPDLGFVFTTPVGTPIDPRNCTRVVQRACKDAGLRKVRMHDFRHGAVTIMLGLGVPPRTVMEIAGHSGLEMTMNVYGHVSLEDKRAAVDRMADAFEDGDLG